MTAAYVRIGSTWVHHRAVSSATFATGINASPRLRAIAGLTR